MAHPKAHGLASLGSGNAGYSHAVPLLVLRRYRPLVQPLSAGQRMVGDGGW